MWSLSANQKIDTNDNVLFLSVTDDEEGIPRQFHKKIFETYFQLRSENGSIMRGSGLGLAGVMVLIEDLEGRLLLESDEGHGAKFCVELPLYAKQGKG